MLKKNIREVVDNVVIMAILSLSFLYILSYFIIQVAPKTGVYTYGNFWYPLISTLEKLVFTFVLGWKTFTFESCLVTKISVILFGLCTVVSLLYCTFLLKFQVMMVIGTTITTIGIILMLLTLIITKLINRYKK